MTDTRKEQQCDELHDISMNDKYREAVITIKTAILKSQSRAAKHTNMELLSLYYAIGGYVSDNSREGTWGTGAIDEISARLREEMPGLRGFSAANIKFMRQFYEAWNPYLQVKSEYMIDFKSIAAVSDLKQNDDGRLPIEQNRLPVVSDFPLDAFTSISFTHHMEIIGILLCREANKSVVELAISDYSKPMGVATYHTADELPGNYKVLAPIIEEVPKMLDEVGYEENSTE